jgi:hypothetical protein
MPEASASAIPTSTPAPTKPTLDQLVVSPNGIGPLVIGQPVVIEPADLATVAFNPHHCGVSPGADYPDWESTYPNPSFSVALIGATPSGTIAGLEVDSPDLKTAEGIHLGSSVADLKTAYPTIDSVTPSYSTDLYTVRGTHGKLVFEVANNAMPGNWTADQLGTVVLETIWQLSDTPTSFANSDGAGGCA